MAGKEKFTKKEVNYESPGKGMDKCADCFFFREGACKIVEGKIKPKDWCDQYERKTILQYPIEGQ